MTINNKNNVLKHWPVYLVFMILIIALVWVFNKSVSGPGNESAKIPDELLAKLSPKNPNPGSQQTHAGADQRSNIPADASLSDSSTNKSLLDIIKKARTWRPAWVEWYGKAAPAFSFQDIKGKTHSLSDYKGKNILLVFWATWCGPCHMEIPHLIELRNKYSENELAILAVSNEDTFTLKRFADSKGINYTVASIRRRPPAPFDNVRSIPSSFYIDKQGKIKLATEGVISEEESEAIILAEK